MGDFKMMLRKSPPAFAPRGGASRRQVAPLGLSMTGKGLLKRGIRAQW